MPSPLDSRIVAGMPSRGLHPSLSNATAPPLMPTSALSLKPTIALSMLFVRVPPLNVDL